MNMESRKGRDNQREFDGQIFSCLCRSDNKQGFGPQGERLVAGVVPLSADKTQVLLIQSTRRGGWVLPKGGWELDEKTASEAACREAWEEAGVICTVETDLGPFADNRPQSELTTHAPKASYQFFECIVKEQKSEWPEMQRQRQWMGYAQAVQALGSRPELLDALKKSSIKKD
jgi:diphosphoinositol-polyphosphate diphosphatase